MKSLPLIIMSLFSFFSCSPSDNFTWPEDWADNMSLSIYFYGGMTPESWEMFVSKDSCVYKRNFGQTKAQYPFVLGKEELRSLMQVMKDNQITRIKTRETNEVVYDMATSGFTFKAGEKEFRVSPSATERLDEKWTPNYRAIYSAALKICHDKLDQQKQRIEIELDSSVRNAGKNLSVIFNFAEQSFSYKADSIPTSISTSLLPGEYEVQIHLTNEGKYGSDMYHASWVNQFHTDRKKVKVELISGQLSVVSGQ